MYKKFTINTGFIFFHPNGAEGESFRFSSELDKVGIEWDVSIKNGTYVEIISDPIEINRKPYGALSLTKIRADIATDYHTIIKEFWIPSSCIVKTEEPNNYLLN